MAVESERRWSEQAAKTRPCASEYCECVGDVYLNIPTSIGLEDGTPSERHTPGGRGPRGSQGGASTFVFPPMFNIWCILRSTREGSCAFTLSVSHFQLKSRPSGLVGKDTKAGEPAR